MSVLTDFAKFFKYEPEKAKTKNFNITEALNNNWDKADAALKALTALNAEKAPISNPAFTGRATLGGKEIPTIESATCELTLGGTLTNGSFVYILRTGEYTRIGNFIDIRGTIEISEVISVPTGEVAIYGLPGIPKNTGIFSINYLRGGQDESMRNCYFAQLIGGKFVFKTLTPSSANPLTAGTLNIVYWGTTARIVTGKNPITVQFAARYFTD